MKKYIAPACEIVNLATVEMLAQSFPVDPDTNVDDMLSNRYENDMDWDEE